jgi:hypothetical protein
MSESDWSDDSEGTVDYPDTPTTNPSTPLATSPNAFEPFEGSSPQLIELQSIERVTHLVNRHTIESPIVCECCQQDCVPVWAPISGPRQLTRLSQINQDSFTGGRLVDGSAVLGECGVHIVCVGCIRQATRDDRPLACIAMGADCTSEYGAGLRWCFDTDEYTKRYRIPERVVRCVCGLENKRDAYTTENTKRGKNIQRCPCTRYVCFDCGRDADCKQVSDGISRVYCHWCRLSVRPPLRTAPCFSDTSNEDVTVLQVIERAVEILRHRGLSVVCDHCSTAIERAHGCKFVTHCGTEICSECNVRGCRSSGSVVGRCCPGSSELDARARPYGRMALSLKQLFSTTQPAARPAALVAMGTVIRQRLV